MIIRFKVSQTELFRRGDDPPGGIVSLDVDPSPLCQNDRELIFRHLLETDNGIDVVYDPEHAKWEYGWAVPIGGHPPDELVETHGPNLSDLLDALRELERHANQPTQAVYPPG